MIASDYAIYSMVERVKCDIQQYVPCIYFGNIRVPKTSA